MGLESLPVEIAAALVLVVLAAGVVQGALGFGFPFIATPLVAMGSDMRSAVVSVLLPTLAVTVANLAKSGPLRPVLRRFWPVPLYAMAGAALGTSLFIAAPHAPYALVLAVLIFLYLNLDRLGLGQSAAVARHERALAPLAGLAAGVFEGTANVAAPPLIIFYLALGLTPAALVQALNICFFAGKLAQFALLASRGGVEPAHWLASLPLAAFAVAGFFAGLRLRRRIDARSFRLWVKRALLAIALVLIARHAGALLA